MSFLTKAGKLKIVFILLALSVCGTAAIYIFGHLPSKASRPPQAVEEVLDLRDWSFGQKGILSLEGQWEFFWRKLLTPEDFRDGNSIARTGYIRVPGTWNGYGLPAGGRKLELAGNAEEQKLPGDDRERWMSGDDKERKLPGEGYATYRLIIHTNGEESVLGLKYLILQLPTACGSTAGFSRKTARWGQTRTKPLPRLSHGSPVFKTTPELLKSCCRLPTSPTAREAYGQTLKWALPASSNPCAKSRPSAPSFYAAVY